MTQREIKNGNELIAAFMGLESFDSRYGKLWENPASDGVFAKTAFDLRYHKSWDLLMSAWKKIGDMMYDIRFSKGEEKYQEACDITERITSAFRTVDISDAFLNLVDAVKWYNSLSK